MNAPARFTSLPAARITTEIDAMHALAADLDVIRHDVLADVTARFAAEMDALFAPIHARRAAVTTPADQEETRL